MGKMILPPLKYIIFFLISFVLFIFITALYNWELFFSPGLEQQNALILFLPSAASSIIYPSASAAILFLIFNSRKRKIHLVSVIIIAAATFSLIYFGYKFSASMSFNAENAEYQPFKPETIHITENTIIYTDSTDGNTVSGIVTKNRNREIPGFRFYQSARFVNNGNPGLMIDSERKISINPDNPIFSDVLASEYLLREYLGDMGFINEHISTSAGGGMEFLLLCGVFTVFLMASLLFRNATSWPLFNFALILFFHRFIFYLFKLFSEEAEFISSTFFGGRSDINMPLITISALTAVLLLTGAFINISARRNTE